MLTQFGRNGRKLLRRLTAAGAAIAVVGAGLTIATVAVAKPAAAESCAPVQLEVFRGSGQNGTSYNNGLGTTLGKFVSYAQHNPLKDGYSIAGAPVYGVPYPAVGMEQYFSGTQENLFDSVEYGRLLGLSYINSVHTNCPTTKFVLVGYSQGVIAARQVAQDVNSDVVAGVWGIGDPLQKPYAPGTAGPGNGGSGILRRLEADNGIDWSASGSGSDSTDDAFYDLSTAKVLYCHALDPICNPGPAPLVSLLLLTGFHTNYGDDPIELNILSAALNVMAEDAAAAGPATGGVGSGTGGAGTPAPLADTSTTLTSSVNPSVHGQPVTLTATVTSGAGDPAGTVTFYDGPNSLGTAPVGGDGTATITTGALSTGTHQLSAFYNGDSRFAPSSGTLTQTVNRAATATTVSSSANPAVYCQAVTFGSTTTAVPPGAGTPTGTVEIDDNGAFVGNSPVDGNGNGTVTTQFFTVGTHPMTASYGGDGDFLPSRSAQLNQVVNKAPTLTTVTATPTSSNLFGRRSTFTAAVTVPPPGCGTPTGNVVFTVDGVTVQTSPLPASGTVTLATNALLPGSHVINASYSGDDNFLASNGGTNYAITCTTMISGAHLGGVAASGESTCLMNAAVNGAVVVPSGTRFASVNSTVTGAVVANTTPKMVALCGTRVGGALQVIGDSELVMVGDSGAVCRSNTINGSILLRNNANGLEAIGNTYGGTLSNLGNSGPGPYGQSTTVTGNTKR